MYSQCKEHGSIGTIPEIPGLLVWKTGHIGVYIGEGYVVQASGFNTGVIQTLLSASPWTNWGKCPFITYDEMPEDVSVVTVEPVYVSGFVDTPNKLTLNLRAEPTKASDRLDRIPNKTSLKFLDAGSGWFKTSYKGKDGYVDSSFINYNGKTKQESLG
jgi:uncharacterized protein YgiM (DUF1202 family)